MANFREYDLLNDEAIDYYDKYRNLNLADNENIISNGFALDYIFDDFGQDMNEFISEFQFAQVNKEANIAGSEYTEGPKDYKEILALLNDCSNTIAKRKENDTTYGQIGQKMDVLMAKVFNYVKSHKPVFTSHKTPESAKRYELMKKLLDRGRVYISSINDTKKKFAVGVKENNVPFSLIDLKCSDLSSKLKSTFGSGFDDDGMKQRAAYGRIGADIIENKSSGAVYRKDVMRMIKVNTKDSIALKIDDYYDNKTLDILKTNKVSSYDFAVAYYCKKDINTISSYTGTDRDMLKYFNKKLEETRKNSEPEIFREKVSKLSASPGFRYVCKYDRVNTLNKIAQIDSRYDKLYRVAEGDINLLINNPDKYYQNNKKSMRSKTFDEYLIRNIATELITMDSSNMDILSNLSVFGMFGAKKHAEGCATEYVKAVGDFIKNDKELLKEIKGKPLTEAPKLIEMLKDPKRYKKLVESARNRTNKYVSDHEASIGKQARNAAKVNKPARGMHR
ncbi:MAG: hypothetical protein K6F77_01175 [Lachnospiraceae bacterium]|nr:hypothetical protein [Lachnospiraceae bacterium]